MIDKKDVAARYAAISEDLNEANLEAPKPAERREFARRAARWAVKITTQKREVLHCRTRDVSERGISVQSPYDFNMRAQVLLEINVTYKGLQKMIKAVGEVRHSAFAGDGFAIGIFLKEAPATTTNFLRNYSNSRI